MRWRALVAAAAACSATTVVPVGATAAPSSPSPLSVLVEDQSGHWWSEPIAGGELTPTGWTTPGTFSPDGTRQAAVVTDDATKATQLVVRSADGADQHVLASWPDPGNVSLEGWTHDGKHLLVDPYAYVPGDVDEYDASTGQVVRHLHQVTGPLSPDLRLSTQAGDGYETFTDVKTGAPAGTFRTKGIDWGGDGIYYRTYTTVDWSLDGSRVVINESSDEFTRDDSGTGGGTDLYTGTLAILDLRTGNLSTIHASNEDGSFTETQSPDGSALCWVDTHLVCGSDIKHPHAMQVPTGGVKDYAIVDPALARLDAVKGRVSTLTAKAAPGRIDVEVRGQNTDGAGFLVVLHNGAYVTLRSRPGRTVGRTVRELRINGLRPSTTYTVTAFPLRWSGTLGKPMSVTVQTPATIGTETKLKVKSGRDDVLTATVVRADTQKPIAGLRVTFYGHQLNPSPVTPYTEFERLGTVVTDAHGRATFTDKTGQIGYAAKVAGTSRYAPSASAEIDLG